MRRKLRTYGKPIPAFLRANISVFIRGLAPAEVSELQGALEKGKSGEIPKESPPCFESEATKGNDTASVRPARGASAADSAEGTSSLGLIRLLDR